MKVGDRVSVVDEDIRGIVLHIKNQQVEIEDKYGFTYIFSQNQLVLQDEELYHKEPLQKKEETHKITPPKRLKNEIKLDLHFDKLVKTPESYQAWERRAIQKEKLLDTLDYCKKNFIKKLLIIHGLGDGILQEMVYDTLRGYSGIEYDENEFFKHFSTSVEVSFYGKSKK